MSYEQVGKKVHTKKADFNITMPPAVMAEKDEVLQRAYKDLIFFGRAFLPKDFLKKSKSPPFHHTVAEKLISTSPGQRICNILPRGFGKSILAKAAIMHKFCFSGEDEQHFFAWVSEEQGQSIDHIKYIRQHFEENKMIKYYFGNLDGGSIGKRWTEKDLVTAKGDRIIAKGTNQRLRGRAEVDVRYTGIILDDFESELNTKTPERRAEIKKWVVSTVYPALEETPGNEGWIWLSGTIVHFDSFLQMICDGYNKAKKNGTSYTWDLTFMRAIMDGKPAWSDQFPLAKLKTKKKEFIGAGLVNKFAQEYMNDARDIGSAAFKIDRIQHHAYEYKCENKFGYIADRDNAIPVNVYIGVDLAATASATSDYQVILVIAVDSNNNRYVLEYFRERIPTFDVPLKIIEMTKKYHPVKRVTIETVAAQEMVRDMVTRLSATERRLMPGIFKGVKPPPGIKKQDRLETSLGPMINSKKLYVREEMTELVDEVFEHPKPRHDDILDALYYADYYARPPRSKKMKMDELDAELETLNSRPMNKVYNWITGAKI
jgi:phage terminase large subunit-like protein